MNYKNLELISIRVFGTQNNPSSIKALLFIDDDCNEEWIEIADVITMLKDKTLTSKHVSLYNNTCFCIDDDVYKKLSKKYDYNDTEKYYELFYYEDYGFLSTNISIKTCKYFRRNLSYLNNMNVPIVPLNYINGFPVVCMDDFSTNSYYAGRGDLYPLRELDLTHFDTRKIVTMRNMFVGFKEVYHIKFGDLFVTSQVINMSRMFKGCFNLQSVELKNIDTSNVRDMSEMFCDCVNLQVTNFDKYNIVNVINIRDMFKNCAKLKYLGTENLELNDKLDISKLISKNCGITEIGVPFKTTQEQITHFIRLAIGNEINLVTELY